MIYENLVIPNTHPQKLKDAAHLFGLNTPDIQSAKILELGCAGGANLISIAKTLPNAELLGIDYSKTQIDIASLDTANAKLNNVRFLCEDISDFKTSEKFDYIICHGVFSWVTSELQNKIFEICKNNLSAEGVAYISYNTMPGWAYPLSIRDMMLFHSAQFNDPTEKVIQARSILEFIKNGADFTNNPAKALFEKEYQYIANNSDSYVYNEYLCNDNHPIYFTTFAEIAMENSLQYICEADPKTMELDNLPKELVKIFSTTNDIIKQQQYLDFIVNRRFRCSLLKLLTGS
jgi:2-polyprenyl-3-methyl-5-hydroxy-6-metoxy-1,4-benzoquinol methylase